MAKLNDNGWSRCEKKLDITDKEIRALFEMIDRDKSGTLTMRVNILNYQIKITITKCDFKKSLFLLIFLGSQKSM